MNCTLIITKKCNYSCSYCCNTQLGDIPTITRFNQVPLDRHESISITGGEPTLCEDLHYITKWCAERLPTYLYTNGSNLDAIKDVKDRLSGVTIGVHMSQIESFKEFAQMALKARTIHDNLRFIVPAFGEDNKRAYVWLKFMQFDVRLDANCRMDNKEFYYVDTE